MDFLLDALTDWLKEMLVGGIMSNLSGMFDSVNQQVADIATQVGQTPQGWNGSIFSMIQNLSNSIMVPIAGVILAIVMTLELIQMITDKNNLHDVDTWMIFKWVFKSAAAILIVSNTWNIVMGVFDAAQSVVAQAAGIIGSDASIDISSVMTDMESRLMDMDLGPLFGLWFQSLFIGITMWALYICIFIVIYAAAKRAGQAAGNTASAAQKTGKAAKTVKEKAQEAGAFVMRHKKGFLIAGAIFLLVCMLLNTMSSCSMMAQSIGSVVSGTTYPSDDPELVAVEADYAAKEAALQAEIDNIESSHPGYDEYRYDLDMIGHDPHELAAYLSAVLQGYTRQSAQAELERVFDAQYELTLTEEVEIRYRTETSTDPVTGETTTEEVPYEYYILNVKLTSKPISSVASELLTSDQLEMYQVYRQTLGNKPLIFGGGSPDMSNSEDLTGVVFVNGTRPGNQAVVDIAKSQVGNVGGQPYWSWYGFNSRVEWCACFVSWCYGQMGLSEPRFAACQSQGIPWFQSHGQWGGRDYANIAPGDAIFFDWDLDGSADHVGLVVGTDGSRVYTVEGNSGDACKIKSYSLTYECIKGYGLMNW